jgi:hypothetical protein
MIDPHALRTLIEQWRDFSTKPIGYCAAEGYDGIKATLSQCADDLEAVLSALPETPAPRPQHELVCEVLRDVRDTLLRSTGDDEEDYCRGVCDACNDSIQRLYMRLPARPTPQEPT